MRPSPSANGGGFLLAAGIVSTFADQTANGDNTNPTAATKPYQAIPPLPTARPLGATVKDTQVVASFATLDGPIEVHMPVDFAEQLTSQLRQELLDAKDQNRPTRQP
jgi:hypothetical protein